MHDWVDVRPTVANDMDGPQDIGAGVFVRNQKIKIIALCNKVTSTQ